MNWILKKLLGYGGHKLNGYKTKIGGAGLILYGLIGAINLMFPEAIPGVTLTIDEVVGYFSGGFVAIGVGGKIDKNTAAVESNNVLQRLEPQIIRTSELTDEQRTALNNP